MKSLASAGARKLQERLDEMESQITGSAPIRRRQLTEALHALQEALEEVETAEAELAQQNDELMMAREALEVERFRYRDLFERAPVGYLVTDSAGTIREANQAATDLLNTQTILGKPLPVFLHPSNRGDLRLLLQEMRSRVGPRETELTLSPRDAPLRRVQVTIVRDETTPGPGTGIPGRLRWVLQDISARRAAEEALQESQERLRHSQRLEAIGRLAGGVAHSFNNLLSAIAFHSELILDEEGSPEGAQRHAMEIQKAGERAAALSRQLLAFSRKQALNPQPLCLSDQLRSLEPMLRRLLGEDIEIKIVSDRSEGFVHADLGQLEQVIMNLVGNARDAMPHGGRLSLRTQGVTFGPDNDRHLPPGTYVELAVADTGTGMVPETLAQIFEPFFTTKERGRGTGLGLATVYGIIRQSGGEIRVESEPGKGSTFYLYLPAVENTAPAAEPRTEEDRRVTSGSEVVLLVEDEDNIREPAAEILESRGYAVLTARNGVEALQVAESHAGPIHLVITDVVMPQMSGSRLAEALRKARPDTRVLYISGYPEDAIAHHGVLEPRHRFLKKPFPPGVLLTTVRELLTLPLQVQDL
jgi:two-component system cell cycle sensor histidine kinase/response regulator CckA